MPRIKGPGDGLHPEVGLPIAAGLPYPWMVYC